MKKGFYSSFNVDTDFTEFPIHKDKKQGDGEGVFRPSFYVIWE